jgi:hypothetical protein
MFMHVCVASRSKVTNYSRLDHNQRQEDNSCDKECEGEEHKEVNSSSLPLQVVRELREVKPWIALIEDAEGHHSHCSTPTNDEKNEQAQTSPSVTKEDRWPRSLP